MSDTPLLTAMEAENVEYVPPTENVNGSGGTVRRSASLGALALALAKSQLEFESVKKDTENPFYRSRYADLAGIIGATQKALAKNGLVIIQSPIVDVAGQQAGVESLMVHSSGEWISSELVLPATMLSRDGKPRFDAQSCGSAQTYARRYSYQALIGVAAEPDDDANKSVGIGSKEAAQDVATKKIAELKAKKANGAPVTTLFYTVPSEHNGHFAEFINIREFGSNLDQVAAEGLKQVLKPFIAKVTKAETVLVSTSKMDDLLQKLAGDCGLTVKLLAAAQ
jgi:ERF superfamily protein